MALNDEQVRRYEEIIRVKDQISDEYLARPDIRGVGVGFKEVGGEKTDELAIRFYVRRKKTPPPHEMLPRAIQGIPTDVIEFEIREGEQPPSRAEGDARRGEAEAVAEVDKEKYDPLIGGISIGPSRKVNGIYISGTLGIMVKDTASGKPMMLSNYHVMCGEDGNAKQGDDICQPSRPDTWTEWCSNCAELSSWRVGNFEFEGQLYGMDAAVAKRTHRETTYRRIADIGDIAGVELTKSKMLGEKVIKRGRKTGETEGVIGDIGADFKDDFGSPYGEVTLENLLVVEPAGVAEPGDSGSILILKSGLIAIGLIFAIKKSDKFTVACELKPVLTELGVSIA